MFASAATRRAKTICCHLIEQSQQSTDPMAYDAACAQIATLLQATMQPNQRVIEEATAHLAQAETQPGAVPCSASPVPCALYTGTIPLPFPSLIAATASFAPSLTYRFHRLRRDSLNHSRPPRY